MDPRRRRADRSPFPAFELKAIDRLDLEAPMRAGTSRLPAGVREELHAPRRAQALAHRVLSPRRRVRIRGRALLWAVALPVVDLLATPLRLGLLPAQVLAGAAFGAAVGFLPVSRLVTGFLLLLLGVGLHLAARVPMDVLSIVCLPVFYFVLGFAVAVGEDLDRCDGA